MSDVTNHLRRALSNFPISGPDPTKGQRAPWRRSAPHGRDEDNSWRCGYLRDSARALT